MRIPVLLTACLLLSILACTSEAAPERAAAANADREMPEVEAIDAATVEQTLCFTAVAQDDAAAKQTRLAEHQEKARVAKADRADALVEAAKSWVVKARDESDPGAYMHADACAQMALRIDPRHSGAKNLRLLVLLNDHRFEDAKVLAKKMLKERPEDHAAWGSLSDALLELGDIAGASAAAQQMIDLKPNLPSYARASYLAWLQNDATAAKIYIQQAHSAGRGQQIREPQAWVLTEAAQLFWHEGDLEGADAGFALALQRQPGYPDALAGRGRIALAKKDYAGAIAFLEESVAKKRAVKALWSLRDAYVAAGDQTRANEVDALLRKVGRTQDPQTFATYLASTSTDVADLSLAVRLLKTEFDARQGPYTRTAYAFALAKAGEAEAAQKIVDAVVALSTPDAELLSRIAFVRASAQNADDSAALKLRAMKLNPHLAQL